LRGQSVDFQKSQHALWINAPYSASVYESGKITKTKLKSADQADSENNRGGSSEKIQCSAPLGFS